MPERLTTEGFVASANMVHGKRYRYDKVVYVNAYTKVVIACLAHGDFEQSPSSHLQGKGCPKCGGTKRLTTEEFVAAADVVHGKRYRYDKVVYVNTDTKVIIACLAHGDFEQSPNSHLQGKGCPKCGGNKKSTTEEFVAKSNAVYGGRYNYDKVDYINSHTKVTITCSEHGDFEQKPNNHLNGSGCLRCGGRAKLTTEQFIAKASVFHGGRCSYNKVVYLNNKTKVIITCLEHGDFEQTPHDHLEGKGCPKCGGREKSNTEKFVAKARAMRGERYNYDKVVYINTDVKVIITCLEHGDFEQTPHDHLGGKGCPKCNSSRGEEAIRKWLVAHHYEFQTQFKSQSCKNKNPLPFDFSVGGVDTQTLMLVEFHGTQHYEPHSFRHSSKDTPEQMEANLAKVQHNDAIKAKWCADNNVPLLVIPYWDKHRIPELLEEFLGNVAPKGSEVQLV